MQRKLVLVAALVGIWAFTLGTAGGHPPGEKPKRIWAGSGGLYVRATLGTYCWERERSGICADAAYPLKVRGRLPVRPRGRVALRFADHARHVRVSLTRVRDREAKSLDWRTRARRPTENPHRWRFRLPRKLRGANRLDISARYPNGDGHFSAGIEVRR